MVFVVNPILPADLTDALAVTPLGAFGDIRYVPDVESTNDLALALAANGAAEGTSVLADMQRAGRGRRGRTWFSPPGAGLYLSVITRPGEGSSLSLITLAAGVAAAHAIATTTRLPIELKWPNDLVIGRPWRKLGGILCESAGAGSRVDAVVIGIGVNLGHLAYPPDVADRATSIEAELGRPVSRGVIAVAVLAALREAVGHLRAGDRAWITAAWRGFGRAGLDGAPVHWQEGGVLQRGLARDLDVDGALLVERQGRVDRLVAGEVLWDRLSRE